MNLPNSCLETFLEGVAEVFVYPTANCTIPVPFCVAQILELQNCSFVNPALHLALTDGLGANVIASSLTAKVTPGVEGSGTIYNFDISASVESSSDNVRDIYKEIEKKDCIVVLKLMDDTMRLCYTLPNTFNLSHPLSYDSNSQRSISMTLKSRSEFIPVTLKK